MFNDFMEDPVYDGNGERSNRQRTTVVAPSYGAGGFQVPTYCSPSPQAPYRVPWVPHIQTTDLNTYFGQHPDGRISNSTSKPRSDPITMPDQVHASPRALYSSSVEASSYRQDSNSTQSSYVTNYSSNGYVSRQSSWTNGSFDMGSYPTGDYSARNCSGVPVQSFSSNLDGVGQDSIGGCLPQQSARAQAPDYFSMDFCASPSAMDPAHNFPGDASRGFSWPWMDERVAKSASGSHANSIEQTDAYVQPNEMPMHVTGYSVPDLIAASPDESSCSECFELFNGKHHFTNLKRHKESSCLFARPHLPFVCTSCGSHYTRKDNLYAHQRKKHSSSS